MIKQIIVAECDICGFTERAKPVFGQNDGKNYVIPDGWVLPREQHEFCICPKCWKKLSKE